MLCSEVNRVALPGSPSTCALDTSITPLPSILLLAFLAIYLPTRLILARRNTSASFSFSSASISRTSTSKTSFAYDAYSSNYSYSSPSESPPRILSNGLELPKWIHWTYVALVVCLFGLRVLEVVRLVLAHMGVGLLPVAVVANVVNVAMLMYGGTGLEMGRRRSAVMSASLVLYWASSTILESVKVTRLASYNAFHPAKGTAYPSSDWLLDNGCMLGLLVIFLFVEGAYLVLRWRASFLSASESIKERKIGEPQPMAEYDPVIYLDERTSGAVV